MSSKTHLFHVMCPAAFPSASPPPHVSAEKAEAPRGQAQTPPPRGGEKPGLSWVPSLLLTTLCRLHMKSGRARCRKMGAKVTILFFKRWGLLATQRLYDFSLRMMSHSPGTAQGAWDGEESPHDTFPKRLTFRLGT